MPQASGLFLEIVLRAESHSLASPSRKPPLFRIRIDITF